MTDLTRRDAVKAAGVLLGGVALASAGMLTACTTERTTTRGPSVSAEEQAELEAIADTILPDTPSSPGARAAGAGAAIALLLTDVYEPAALPRVREGLARLHQRCVAECGGGFRTLEAARRTALLTSIDAEARAAGAAHWFTLVHELSLKAYFSSEVGMTQALRYVHEPHRYTGCVPRTPGQPAWA